MHEIQAEALKPERLNWVPSLEKYIGKDAKKDQFLAKEGNNSDSDDDRYNYQKKEFKYADELEDLDGCAPQRPFTDFIKENWIKVPISH